MRYQKKLLRKREKKKNPNKVKTHASCIFTSNEWNSYLSKTSLNLKQKHSPCLYTLAVNSIFIKNHEQKVSPLEIRLTYLQKFMNYHGPNPSDSSSMETGRLRSISPRVDISGTSCSITTGLTLAAPIKWDLL